MRIAALYLPEGYLPHVFGKDHNEITINFGARNLYLVTDHNISDVKPNPYYLEDIFKSDISLFSCIVGGNGGGEDNTTKIDYQQLELFVRD